MTYITVDDQQAKLIVESSHGIEVRDRSGNRIGYVSHGFSTADIALAQQRLHSSEERIPTHEVLNHLRSLEAK